MARISAITNDGKEQSKAEGNLKSVLKMASLIAGNNHQIIINKNELDGFVTESKLVENIENRDKYNRPIEG